MLAFSSNVAINCGLGILVFFGLGAKVYNESRTVLSKIKSGSSDYGQSLWHKKRVNSFPIQRIPDLT